MRHTYPQMDQRLLLCIQYEHRMYRNYMIEGHKYHAMHIAFMESGAPYVVLSNVAVAKDRLLIPLEEFDALLKGGDNANSTGVSTEVQSNGGEGGTG